MTRRKTLDLPKHNNPTSADRTACAPYNFVPLPDKVVLAVEDANHLPDHDTYAHETYKHTGYFDVTLTTKSPLYVRCALTRKMFDLDERGLDSKERKVGNGKTPYADRIKNMPNFFYTRGKEQPVIPGSSLRGMLRNLLEIVSYAKMQWLTDKKLFFRSVDKSEVGRHYSRRMMKVEGGFWRKTSGGYEIEKCIVARVLMHPYLRTRCLQDAPSLAVKLRDKRDKVSGFISGKLKYQTARMLGDYDGSSVLDKDLRKALLKDLNALLGSIDLYHEDRFPESILDSELKGHVSQSLKDKRLMLTGEKLIQFNRLLLEAAYPNEIRKSLPEQTLATAFGNGNFIELYEGSGSSAKPRWDYQQSKVWIPSSQIVLPDADDHNGDVSRFPEVTSISAKQTSSHDREVTLVLTGPMQGKKRAFLFIKQDTPETIEVPNDKQEEDANKRLVERFQDDDQLTPWQEGAFLLNKPYNNARSRNGYLRADEPVFFLRESKKLVFFGRAQMFRLPYRSTPRGLVPKELRSATDTDFGEAMFGYTKPKKKHHRDNDGVDAEQGSKGRAYAGRVFVMDAVVVENSEGLWLSNDPFTPKILATPKPTSFQLYLTQQDPNYPLNLDHYDSPPPHETTIRGHKVYWHQGDREVSDIAQTPPPASTSTQYTKMKPVKSGVRFKFRVYFENLSDEELGAMCWTLHPLGDANKTYVHKLGMGKPFGMGAVELKATLHLSNRQTRYESLFDGAAWRTGYAADGEELNQTNVEKWAKKFEEKVINEFTFKPGQTCARLSDLKRIAVLLKMMEWSGYPARMTGMGDRAGNTRYMTITPNEYKERPVLPDPSATAFGGLTGDAEPEPDRPSDNPPPVTEVTRRGDVPTRATVAIPTPRVTQAHAENKATKTVSLSDIERRQAERKQAAKVVEQADGEYDETATVVEIIAGDKVVLETKSKKRVTGKLQNSFLQIEAGDRCRAKIRYLKGEAVSAKVISRL